MFEDNEGIIMRWTKDKPKHGWYWMRKANQTPEIVEVDRGYVMGKSYGAPLGDSTFDDAEWAGPIPMPKEDYDVR